MQQKKNAAKKGMKVRAGSRTEAKQQAGGREFGNVIEPMQAQMASGNKGLTADVGSGSMKPTQRKTGGSRKSAA